MTLDLIKDIFKKFGYLRPTLWMRNAAGKEILVIFGYASSDYEEHLITEYGQMLTEASKSIEIKWATASLKDDMVRLMSEKITEQNIDITWYRVTRHTNGTVSEFVPISKIEKVTDSWFDMTIATQTAANQLGLKGVRSLMSCAFKHRPIIVFK